uniref:Uncharacterized protein n=1 Tax=Cacopsylla melanoneura TaxID=428564 RepID=A0A8D9AEV3_9HEMI
MSRQTKPRVFAQNSQDSRRKVSADSMFEFCDIQEWKYKTPRNDCNEEYQLETNGNLANSADQTIPRKLLNSNQVSLIKLVPSANRRASTSEEKSSPENLFKITNLTGNATWDKESSILPHSPDPFDSSTGVESYVNTQLTAYSHYQQGARSPNTKKPRGRGRPRKYPPRVITRVKRGRGRPKKADLGNSSMKRRKSTDSENSEYRLGMDIVL